MKTTNQSEWRYLRLLALPVAALLGLLLCGGTCLRALGMLVVALGAAALWAGWVGGPLLLAIGLAFAFRERRVRVLFDGALVLMILVDFLALFACVLPVLRVEGVFFWVPLLQYGSLTALLAAALLGEALIPELAKLFRSGTFNRT